MRHTNGVLDIPEDYNDDKLGGHMILILGWNETGFIIQNSWGKDWGNEGCGILPYEYRIDEAWGVSLNDQADNSVKKPAFYLLRIILQKLIDFIGQLLRR